MPQQHNALLREHEGRLELALKALQAHEFRSQRAAARAFNVKHQKLSNRARGVPFILERQLNGRKLTLTKEQTIVQYILDLDSRGFAPRLCEVADMADKLLGVRGGEPVSKH
jgi:hypothetical protein